MATRELIDRQVEDNDRLEAEQALSFAPALFNPRARIKVQASDHEQGHHTRLKDDPTLLDSVSERVIVKVLIELVLREMRRPPTFNLWHCL